VGVDTFKLICWSFCCGAFLERLSLNEEQQFCNNFVLSFEAFLWQNFSLKLPRSLQIKEIMMTLLITDEKVVFIYVKSSVCGGEKRLTTTIKA
jgi:hypothetical protein